jgi:hypothetical protein
MTGLFKKVGVQMPLNYLEPIILHLVLHGHRMVEAFIAPRGSLITENPRLHHPDSRGQGLDRLLADQGFASDRT